MGEIVEHEFGTDGCTYERLGGGKVKCLTCAHECVIPCDGTGFCAVRKNQGGDLRLIVYASANCVNSRDPIEKKRDFCQNDDLSQCTKDIKKRLLAEGNADMIDVEIGSLGYKISPKDVVEKAVAAGCKIIAYTYNEPTVFFEYAIDTARLAHERGLLNVFKSNGFESEHTVRAMRGLIDAVNVDLKSFSDDFYRKICESRLQPVLDTIQRLHDSGIWTEVTTLVVPGENDDDDQLNGIAQFIASVDPDIPWHITPFHPAYKMTDRARTGDAILDHAYQIGKRAGLRFVYARTGDHECTFCPGCGSKLVQREGIFGARVLRENFANGVCLRCKAKIPGVWLPR